MRTFATRNAIPSPSGSCSAPTATTTSCYSLASAAAPMAVAVQTYDTLPLTLRELLPTDVDLVTAMTDVTELK